MKGVDSCRSRRRSYSYIGSLLVEPETGTYGSKVGFKVENDEPTGHGEVSQCNAEFA